MKSFYHKSVNSVTGNFSSAKESEGNRLIALASCEDLSAADFFTISVFGNLPVKSAIKVRQGLAIKGKNDRGRNFILSLQVNSQRVKFLFHFIYEDIRSTDISLHNNRNPSQ